jgi:hypothetical protein
MLKVEYPVVYGWEPTIRGMRNPMNSWDKIDSHYDEIGNYVVGPEDLKLMKNLANAGPDHGKFLRMLVVYVDITAPLYWWKEFDTYKVGTVANSCSTMHKIHAKKFSLDDFSHEHLSATALSRLEDFVDDLNQYRKEFVTHKDKSDWFDMIQTLPSSYNQKRTVMLNYQVLKSMYHARRNHKLDEWHTFCDFITTLPHSELITGEDDNPCTTSN